MRRSAMSPWCGKLDGDYSRLPSERRRGRIRDADHQEQALPSASVTAKSLLQVWPSARTQCAGVSGLRGRFSCLQTRRARIAWGSMGRGRVLPTCVKGVCRRPHGVRPALAARQMVPKRSFFFFFSFFFSFFADMMTKIACGYEGALALDA